MKQIDPTLRRQIFNVGATGSSGGLTRRFVGLLGGFSLLALILSALESYGVIFLHVSQRTHEIGIRLGHRFAGCGGASPDRRTRVEACSNGVGIGLFAHWCDAGNESTALRRQRDRPLTFAMMPLF